MFQHQRDVLNAQLKELQHTLKMVEYKCWYYETAKAAGSISAPKTCVTTIFRKNFAPSGRS